MRKEEKAVLFVSLIIVVSLASILIYFSNVSKQAVFYNPPEQGLVASYSFEGNANDGSGNGNTGTASGGVTYSAGKSGQAISLDGTGYVEVGDSQYIQLPNSGFSIELWFKPNSLTSDQIILSKGVSDANEEYSINLGSNGEIYFDYGNNAYAVTSAGAASSPNQWYHLVAVYDPATSPRGKIYINGILQSNAASADGEHIVSSGSNLYIGSQNRATPYYGGRTLFNGVIDEVKIYNKALTVSEIQNEYNGGLAASWKFEEGTGKTAGDSSGNNNAGSIIGGATWATGKVGGALSFDGSGYVRVSDSAFFDFAGTQNTISFWIKSGDTGDRPNILRHSPGGDAPTATAGGWYVKTTGNKLYIGGWNSAENDMGSLPADNNWHHVAIVQSDSSLMYYKDGTLMPNPITITSQPSDDGGAALWIAGPGSSNYALSGMLDEIKIYNKALTASEIQSDFNNANVTANITSQPCVSNWTLTNKTCLPSDIYNYTYADTNSCINVSSGPPVPNQASIYCDYDRNGLVGTTANAVAGRVNLAAKVEGLPINYSSNYTGVKRIEFMDGASSLVGFEWNLSSPLNLYNVKIEKQGADSNRGYLLIQGIEANKTVFVDRLVNNSNRVCIIDSAITTISSISYNCINSNEINLLCPGTSKNYSCVIIANKFKISGLLHSGMVEFVPAVSAACISSWNCTGFGSCIGGLQTRTCRDLSNCGTTAGKPVENQTCAIAPVACTPNWGCTDWNPEVCSQSGRQTRTCTDSNKCGTTAGRPLEAQACEYKPSTGGITLVIIIFSIFLILVAGVIGYILYRRKKGTSKGQPPKPAFPAQPPARPTQLPLSFPPANMPAKPANAVISQIRQAINSKTPPANPTNLPLGNLPPVNPAGKPSDTK